MRYEILEEIGAGGFSKVYKVKDRNIGTIFVAKEIADDVIAETEIAWLKALAHPGVPRLHDVVRDGHTTMIVMENMEGDTLKEVVKKNGVMDTKRCRKIISELAELLSVLHSQNVPVIHGDLKPENIILLENDKIALLDLGGASYLGEMPSVLCGTKGYLAPERKKGEVHVQNDIYSVGRIMQYMLTGCEPSYLSTYKTEEIAEYFHIEENVAKVIVCATNPEPEKRFVSINHLKEALYENENMSKKERQKYTKIWFVLALLFIFSGFLFALGNALYEAQLLIVAGNAIAAVGFLVRKAEKESAVKILACEYSVHIFR